MTAGKIIKYGVIAVIVFWLWNQFGSELGVQASALRLTLDRIDPLLVLGIGCVIGWGVRSFRRG
ncbi:MAG: hypothetical protein M1546_00360 [Chloroflexi bacterium]|nr:hypothetical protein [Chloroflexota bacterium]